MARLRDRLLGALNAVERNKGRAALAAHGPHVGHATERREHGAQILALHAQIKTQDGNGGTGHTARARAALVTRAGIGTGSGGGPGCAIAGSTGGTLAGLAGLAGLTRCAGVAEALADLHDDGLAIDGHLNSA
jgi:hypothetical protein